MGCDYIGVKELGDVFGFNSRTPCGVRRRSCILDARRRRVSIHAPRVGCDAFILSCISFICLFQFTHPVWGATCTSKYRRTHSVFQFTHPVWGATAKDKPSPPTSVSFNSRTPCGVRLYRLIFIDKLADVSIHAPRVGCDPGTKMGSIDPFRFNSRTPCGVRHKQSIRHVIVPLFQFTHPVWGAT